MSEQQAFTFSFTIDEFDPETFSVVSFKGHEGISTCYQYEIVLAASSLHLDHSKILYQHCKLEIAGQEKKRTIPGIIFRFRHIRKSGSLYYYQIILTPKLQLLSLTTHSRVFLDKPFPKIMEKILHDADIPYKDKITKKEDYFPTCEYISQFNETDYNFICRWLEAHGVHFFFKQQKDKKGGQELLFLSDSSMAHEKCPLDADHLTYLPVSGLDHELRESMVRSFISEFCCLPENTIFKDYNYTLSNPIVEQKHDISSKGLGTDYHYGECFLGQGYKADPASIHADELKSTESLFHGESYCPYLETGHTFQLQKHYHEPYNTEYLVAFVQHEGVDKSFLKNDYKNSEKGPKQIYSNTFRAIPAAVLYRPQKRTPVPHFFGLLSATIDAEGSGDYAELDKKGRYKIRLPFDLEDKNKGKASHWIRMAEPYAGNAAQDKAFGMHFPLLKGTEVLISFVEGDIDRPVITSALYNASHENPVTSANNNYNILKSKSGNKLVMNDLKGKESVGIATAGGKTIFVASNDPDNPGITSTTTKKVVQATTNDSFTAKAGSSVSFTVGTDFGAFAGSKMSVTGGITSSINLGWSLSYGYGLSVSFGSQKSAIHNKDSSSAEETLTFKAGMNTVVKGYYSSIKKGMFVSAIAALATNMGSWAAIAGAKGGYSDIDSTAAEIAGSITGSLGAVIETIGTIYATKNYYSLSKEVSNALFASCLELGPSGTSLTVVKDTGTSSGLNITVGRAKLDYFSSTITIDGKGETVSINNQGYSKLKMDKGKLFEVSVGMLGTTKLSMPDNGNIDLGAHYGGNLIIPTTVNGKIQLKKNIGGIVELDTDGVTLSSSSSNLSNIKVTSDGIQIKSSQTRVNATATVKISANGMIMVG